MHDFINSFRKIAGTNGVLTILAGVLFCIWPLGAPSLLITIAGAILACSGVSDLVRYFRLRGTFLSGGGLITGIIKTVLALYMLTHASSIIVLISYILAIIILVQGVSQIETALNLRKAKLPGWIVNFAIAAAMVLFGLSLLFRPLKAASGMFVLLGILLIIDGALDLFTAKRLRVKGTTGLHHFDNLVGKEPQTVYDMEQE